MRKKDDTLQEVLLGCAREIAASEGLDAINIRVIAQRAGVATGTVYNYFANKDEILLALTEEYWREVMGEMQTAITADTFLGQLEEIFTFLRDRIDRSAGRLMGSLHGVETVGRARMTSMQAVLEQALVRRMAQDQAISQAIWTEAFTPQAFAGFIMANLTILLKQRADAQCFLEVVSRILYQTERKKRA